MTPSLATLDQIVIASRGNTRLGRLRADKGVRASDEFRRINELPRRAWASSSAEALAVEMTELLRQPTGTMTLRPTQAVALLELGMYAGLLGPLRAGAGKSLVTYLAPYVMGAERPVLLVPAKLRDKTLQEIAELSKHWRVAYWLHVRSYEELGRVGCATFLQDLRCDLLIADEAHKLKNPKAAVTRRVRRHVETSDCRIINLSGTFTKRSVRDYSHLAKWALDDGSPVPRTFADSEEWACALDERPRSNFRVAPGALTLWSKGSEDLDDVRIGYQERVTQTPGVVATYDKLADCSLVISRVEIPEDPATLEAFTRLRDKAETPDGWPLIDGLSVARHAKEMSLGFFYLWSPRGPESWMQARREWGQFVRYVLGHSKQAIDSELQVRQAAALGQVDVPGISKKLELSCDDPREAWDTLKDTFKPNSVPVWISGRALELCAEWLKEPGIAWCKHVAFAEALSDLTGIPYAGAGGLTADGRTLESLKGAPVIASVASSGEGRNLQAWSRNLLTCPLSLGADTEQLLARTHRDGQEADEVIFDVLSGCFENEASFAQARRDADYIYRTTGQEQRLGYASVLWDPHPEVGPIWSKT